MKKSKTFKVGDKVFAKVKGYPAWPAVIIEDQTTKYNVKFYGTGETGIVKSKDLFYYLKHKNTFVKSLKRKDYNEAIEEIEKAIQACGGSDGNTEDYPNDTDTSASLNSSTNVNDSIDSNKSNKRKRSMSTDKPNESLPKKKLISSTTNDNTSDIVKDVKLNNEESQNTTTVEEENTKIEPDHSPRKVKTKTLASANIKKETVKSANTSSSEISLATADLARKEGNKENLLHAHPYMVKGEGKSNRTENASPVVAFYQIKVVTDDYLQAIIAYAEHVKRNEEACRKKPVEKRKTFKNEVVMAKLPSGKYIGIKYNRDPPPTFANEFERAEYDEAEAKTILSLKNLLEDGKCNPEDDPNLFEMELQINEEEIIDRIESDLIEQKKVKLRWLKTEASVMELDAKIKACLGLDKAEPKKALESLDMMMQLNIDPLMLKKHPHVVDMIKRLRRYIGNVKEWNLTEEQLEIFQMDAENIRERAEDVYEKFEDLFNMTDEVEFWNFFTELVEEFKQQVKDMKESEVFALNSEPNSRQAFLDRLNEEEEMKIIVSKMEKTNKREKENSNKTTNSENASDDKMETSVSTS